MNTTRYYPSWPMSAGSYLHRHYFNFSRGQVSAFFQQGLAFDEKCLREYLTLRGVE